MKKFFVVLFAAVLVFCSGCKNNGDIQTTTQPSKTADMLVLPTNKKNYADCVKRYYAVVSAVISKVQVLETEHNKALEAEDPEKFFLNDNYISTGFDPFLLKEFPITENFDFTMDEAKARELFSSQSNGADIQFEKNTTNSFVLRFVEEQSMKEYTVDYSSSDSFRYVCTQENGNETEITEMLEFAKKNSSYYIQSLKTRLAVQFDANGNIVYFCCSTLKDGNYLEESIYPQNDASDNWTTEKEKDEYLSIHTYQNGALIHEECSSGPWKTITISEKDYSSAFPLQ